MSEFPRAVLGDLIIHQKGFAFKSKDYQEDGIPVVRVSNFTDDSIDTSDLKFISKEIAQENQKVELKTDDVIIATVGSWPKNPASIVGKTICVPSEMNGSLMNQNSVILRVKNDSAIDQKYLFIALKTKLFSEYLVSTAQGSANQASVTLGDIFSYEVEWPDPEIRKSIVSMIDSMNQKIKLNRQTNQTLENIAQAIFKSWFVDFEPTCAKIAAKQNGQDPERAAMAAISGKTIEDLNQLSPRQQQSLKTTAALFPDTLMDSELGEIPEGWDVVSFKDIVKKYIDNRGKTPPITDSGIPLLEVKHLPEGSIKPNLNTTKYVDDETFESWFRAHLKTDDIMISTVGTIGRICMVPEGEKIAIAQNLLGMRFKREKASPFFMYYQMDGYRFRHDVDARLVTTVQASIKRKDLETIDLLLPPVKLQNSFEKFVKPFVSMQQSNQEIEVAEIRDTLLPKLLSGKLNIDSEEAA